MVRYRDPREPHPVKNRTNLPILYSIYHPRKIARQKHTRYVMCQLLLCLNALSSFFFVSFIIAPAFAIVSSS